MKKNRWQWRLLIAGILCLYIGLTILINFNGEGNRTEVIGGSCCAIGGILVLLGMRKSRKKNN